MGALSDYLAANAGAQAPSAPLPEDPSILGEASKGLSRGLRNAGANIVQAGGLGAEAAGFPGMAKTLRGGAASLRQGAEAPEFAAESPTWDSVQGPAQTMRWAMGHAGEMLPIAGAGVVGGMVAGPAGAVATMTPDMIGQIDQGQQADPTQAALPVGERALRAGGLGLVGGAVQAIPFGSGLVGGAAAKSLVGAATKNIGAGVITGALGTGAADVATQYGVNPGAPIDTARTGEAMVGGGVVGGAFHAPGTIASLAKGAGTSVGELAGRAKNFVGSAARDVKDAAGEALAGARTTADTAIEAAAATPAGKRVNSLTDDLGELLAKGRTRVEDTIGKISRGDPVGIDMKEFAAATQARASDLLGMADGKAMETAKKWGQDLLDRLPMDDPRAVKVQEALTNVGDRASQATIATMQGAVELSGQAGKKLTEWGTKLKTGYDEMKARKGAKLSEDYAGADEAVVSALKDSGFDERRPEIFSDPGNVRLLAANLRMTMEQMKEGPLDKADIAHLTDVMGPDTLTVLTRLGRPLTEHLSATETSAYFKNLDAIATPHARGETLKAKLKSLLAPEQQGPMSAYDLTRLRDGLLAHARGDHMSGTRAARMDRATLDAHSRVVDGLAHTTYAEHFGKNADEAYALIQKEAGFANNELGHNDNPLETHQELLSRSTPDYTGEVDSEGRGVRKDRTEYAPAGADKAAFDENGDRVTPQAMDSARFGVGDLRADGGQRTVLVSERQGALKANPTSEKNLKFKQHLSDLKAKYPEDAGYSVRYEKTPGREDGHFVVDSPKDPESFSIQNMDEMKLDTKNHSKSDSAIKVGGHIIDTMRLTSAMRRSMPEGELPGTYREQLAEAFKRGIARLTAQFGKEGEPLVIPDAARIGSIGGRDVTWGQVKNMRHGETESESLHRQLNDVATAWSRATWTPEQLAAAKMKPLDLTDAEVKAVAKKHAELEKQIELARQLELGSGMDTQEQGGKGLKTPANFIGAAARGRDLAGGSEAGNSPRARSMRAQNSDKGAAPFEDKALGRYDEDGNLTKAGVLQMLQGDAHGGIDPNGYRSRIEEGEKYEKGVRKVEAQRVDPARFDLPSVDGGQGRTAMGKDENIHTLAALHGANDGEMINRSNMEGGKTWPSGVVDKKTNAARDELQKTIEKWHNTDTPETDRNVERGQKLLNNADMLSAEDHGKLMRLAENNKYASSPEGIANATEVLKGLMLKYRGAMAAPGEGASRLSSKGDYAPNPVKFTTESKAADGSRIEGGKVESAKPTTRVPPINEGRKPTWIGSKGEAISSSGGKPLPKAEGTPSPKAQAAQKAAIQKTATSGDHEALAHALVERFAPGMKLTVVEDASISSNGLMRSHKDGTYTMSIKPGLSPVYKAAVVAHEFGHALQWHTFEKAPAHVRNRITMAYEADVKAMAGANRVQLIDKFGHAGDALRVADGIGGKATDAADGIIARRDAKHLAKHLAKYGEQGYTLKFDEWFANQVSKYATSNDFAGLHPEVQTFWKQAVAALKEAYQQVIKTMVPSKNFGHWMRDLADSVQAERQGKADRLVERANSDHPGLLKELKNTEDVKSLQRAVQVLAERAPESKAMKAANERMEALSKNPDNAYALGLAKYSMESTRIHEELGRPGFGATHDSPIRHEGTFDWRAHQGKGEGNAAFGAGTYLSTADGVHKTYKTQFNSRAWGAHDSMADDLRRRMGKRTAYAGEAVKLVLEKGRLEALKYLEAKKQEMGDDAEWTATVEEHIAALKAEPAESIAALRSYKWGDDGMRSKAPTYHVSVDIKPEQLLDWDAPLSKQSDLVWHALDKLYSDKEIDTGNIEDLHRGAATGAQLYSAFVKELGSQRAASDALQEYGILGHKYAASGGKNDAHPNYVIYDDSKIANNHVSFDKTKATNTKAQTPAEQQVIRDHIEKTLGPAVKTEFANLTHAGEFQRMNTGDVIRLSVHALNPMSTAYHESLHGFFAQLRGAGAKDVMGVLEKAAQSQHIMQQLTERYKGQPEVLRQLADPEERVAYMYQTWASDPTFKVSPAYKSMFTKVADFIRNLMGVWTNDERALHIMDYFHSGQYAANKSSPSFVRRAMMETHRSAILDNAGKLAEPMGRLADSIVSSGSARLRETGVPALSDLANLIKRDHLTEGGDQGFIQAARVENSKRMAALGERLQPYSDPAHMNDAMESLQKGTRAATPEGRLAAAVIKATLKETREYMVKAGVDVGTLGDNYFPRVWDVHYISKNQQAFRDMLEPYVRSGELKGSVDKLIGNLISRGGVELGIESREPGMQFTKGRVLDFIKHLDAAEFVNKDLMGTLVGYVSQATRKAEWTRRLGQGKLEALLERAKEQGATDDHLKTAESYMKGVDGTLGDTLNPDARRLMGNMIVYQNVRLLPAAAFSMLIDPNGVMVRGGTVGDAWNTFKRGISGIPKTFNKEGGEVHDQATKWAELVGVVDSAMVTHAMGDLYTQGMVGGTAKKINDTFFKYNLVEGLNRNFRIGATEAGIKFLARHSGALENGLGDSTHSLRWMKELGLQKGDVVKTKDGIALTQAEGLSAEQEQRVHGAINQWVDGAILRPDAADKPVWMNDPHFALVSHLKQFVYSFQKTILERVVHEVKAGNYTPMMALASYVPVMMAADMAKGLVTTGGQPTWQAGWGPIDYLEYALERSGMFGVGQIPIDMVKDVQHGGVGVGALAGPTFEQLGDVVSSVGGHKQWSNTMLSAMPANAFMKGWSGKGIQDAGPTASD